MQQVEEVVFYYLALPLERPYVLSFGTLHHFDSFVAVARFSDGTMGIGESCPLPGYSHETVELLHHEYTRLARTNDWHSFLERNQGNPFVTAPILTCLEGPALPGVAGAVELCPILQWQHEAEIPERIAALARHGHRVAKVKLAGSLAECTAITRQTIPAGQAHGVRFRYDANQALTLPIATELLRLLDHPSTELLEQPLPVDAWEDMTRLHALSPVPLMLDESIVDLGSVRKAAACADLVKLKLAKNGSPARLIRLIEDARALGLDVVLGNGVQGTVGCWLEAKVQLATKLSYPGEMNGFRKLRDNPLAYILRDTGRVIELSDELPAAKIRQELAAAAEKTWTVSVPSRALTVRLARKHPEER